MNYINLFHIKMEKVYLSVISDNASSLDEEALFLFLRKEFIKRNLRLVIE